LLFGSNKLSENEIIAQSLIFFLAGHGVTAATLTFCSFELALNQHIQQTLYNEIKCAVDSNDGNLSYDVLMQLPYLDAVICETLRKYPPNIVLRRETSTEYKLDDYNVTLPKHLTLEINHYSIHHCEQYYPNPEKFIPDRFLPENRHKIVPYSYLPFGLGPRNCVGMRFALMQAKLCLALTVNKYRFIRSGGEEEMICIKDHYRLLIPDKAFIQIQKRD
jgi:cytochrome P450 family 6